MARVVLVCGLAGGVLIVALRLVEYRFLVIEHSLEIYGGIIVLVFAALGIRLGLMLTRTRDPPSRPERPTEPTVICTSMMGFAPRPRMLVDPTSSIRSTPRPQGLLVARPSQGSAPAHRIVGQEFVHPDWPESRRLGTGTDTTVIPSMPLKAFM